MTFNFNAPYNRENWIEFLRQHFLPQDFSHIAEKVNCEFKPNCINEDVFCLGESQSLKLKVYEMHHDSENDPRIGLSRDAFKFIEHQKVKNALIMFISKNSENYRLSLITRELKLEGKKITKEFTNPKRYSYFMGPDVKKHTIEEFLVKRDRVKDEEDLKSRFSVEIVNKDFYNNIAELFTELVGGVRKIGKQTKEFKPLLRLPDTTDHTIMQEFSVRLIGRIVFCWFLKKKKSINGIPLIHDEVLSVNAIKDNYYHTILESLFFEVMNTPKDERNEFIKKNKLFENIPFLNGGLFDPNLHQDYYKYSPMEKEYKPAYDLKIPDDWFIKFFSVLELYNFTIDENTSVDIELSVDPEMLGRIFENLLAEINPETQQTARKATGSYYTPRPIVEYMVDESLIQYLLTNLESISEENPPDKGELKGVNNLETKIRNLLDYTIEENELTKDESLKVIDALDKIKILDPACGSGAFPMGILQKMLLIRQKVDPESIEWVMKQLEMIPDKLVRKTFEEKLMDENWDYKYKMSAILHSIYGVDIQTIAVELSKLRFFLTLMVDETVNDDKPNRGINELPNLSFKFVAANTLIGLPEAEKDKQMDLMDFDNLLDPMMNKLEKLREQFFYASGNKKTEIEKEFKNTQTEIGQFLGREGSTNKRAVALANWDPFADKSSDWFDPKWMFGIEDGFDIVIGNPPYGANIDDFIKLFEKIYPKTSKGFKDIYKYFFNCSLVNLTSKTGVLCFITPNTFLLQPRYADLRSFLLEFNILSLINLGEDVFDAVVPTTISIVQGRKQHKTNEVKFADISDASKYQGSMECLNFKSIKQDLYLQTPNNIFTENIRLKAYDEEILVNILDFKDAGINYQRVNVGLSDKGRSNLSERLLYEGQKEKSNHIEYWKGSDISAYYISPITNRYVRPNIMLKDNERVILNRNYFNIAPKLIWRQTAQYPIATIDFNGVWFGRSIQSGIIKAEYSKLFSYEYLCCLLNSFYLRNLYEKNVKEGGRVFPQVKLAKLKPLPIKIISVENQQPFIKIVDQILLDKKASSKPDSGSQNSSRVLEDKIDLMVYKLYELTYEEVKIVDPNIDDVLAKFGLGREEFERMSIEQLSKT